MNEYDSASAWVKPCILGIVLTMAAVGAAWLEPDRSAASATPRVELRTLVPTAFGLWRAGPEPDSLTVNQTLSKNIDAVYADSLERVYAHAGGAVVMLSIAYGDNQLDDSVHAHRPEYCYKAQGFTIGSVEDDVAPGVRTRLPVRRVTATQGTRREAITYWMVLGDRPVLPGLTRKLEQMRHGLAGSVPDGMLVRVSSIGPDTVAAQRLNDRFIAEMLAAVPPAGLERIQGRIPSDTVIPILF